MSGREGGQTSGHRPRIIALVGPTGAGKTELGIDLALRFDAEVVNADSRQVYRRLDIGSAKPTCAQRAAVAHHLIDVVEPDAIFDCAHFRRLAIEAIADITSRGKRVLVVGGTGLYIKVLVHGLFDGPGRDAALRTRFLDEERVAPGSLHRRLSTIDPTAAARLHPHDRIRLVRALEVYEHTGRSISAWQSEHGFAGGDVNALVLALWLPRPALYARIDARCHSMVRDGLVDEVRRLYASGLGPTLPALRSPGYREMGEHVRGVCDLPTAVARMAQATRRLAKRQLTWFRGDPEVVWCAPELAVLHRHADKFWSAA